MKKAARLPDKFLRLIVESFYEEKNMDFNEKYYEETIRKYNYNPLEFAPMDFTFFGIPKNTMRLKWLCHSGLNSISNFDSTIVTTGVGLSGIPHMGTLSQILRTIFLQMHGVNVQLVLGDLDSYNARNKSLDFVLDLSKKYTDFIQELGFDRTKGILRSQNDYCEINRLAYLLSKYVSDQDFLDTEEDLSELYISERVYEGITFPVKQAILLMIADFIALDKIDHYKNIIVMLGLEEHKYILLARKVLERIGTEANLCSMYSRIIKGLRGYPKMSKSIPASSIRVDMSSNVIRNQIKNEDDLFDIPEGIDEPSDFALAAEEIEDVYKHCARKDVIWQGYKREFAERLVKICAKWK